MKVGILLCICGLVLATSSGQYTGGVPTSINHDDELFLAVLARNFQSVASGQAPSDCPDYEFPILVPPSNNFRLRPQGQDNAPISYKKRSNKSKRYSPFIRLWKDKEGKESTNLPQKRYSPFVRFWKNIGGLEGLDPERFEDLISMDPAFEELLVSLQDRPFVNVKRTYELVTILQNGQVCFAGRKFGVRIPNDSRAIVPFMAFIRKMIDGICPVGNGCILERPN